MSPLDLLLLGGCTLLAAVSIVISWRPTASLTWCELLLAEELSLDQVVALMRHLGGIRQGPICLRLLASQGQTRFFLGAPEAAAASIVGVLRGLMPEARLDPIDPLPGSEASPTVGAHVGWAGPWPLLNDKSAESLAAGLLGVLSHTSESQAVVLQTRLWPVGWVHRPLASSERSQAQVNPWFMRLWWPAEPPREEIRPIRAKFSGLLLRTELTVASTGSTKAAATTSVHQVIGTLRTAGGIRGVLRYRVVSGARSARILERRREPLPWESSTLLSPEELAAVVALPVGTPVIQGVDYGTAPRLMPSRNLPERGRIFAVSNWPSTAGRVLAQPIAGGLQHTVIVGPTGSGKSTLVGSLVTADMQADRGAFVLDLKGDLVSDLLHQVPAHRVDDVVVLEPARGGKQPGLQLFPEGSDPELTADLVLGTLREMFRDSWGIRSSQYLGLGLKSLAVLPDSTLIDLPLLFSDERFRTQVLEQVKDPWVHAAWRRYLALSAAERAVHVSSPLTKLEELVGRSRIRLVLGQSHPKLDFNAVLSDHQIVLISLPPGLLGMPATQLLAALTLWQFFQAVEARARIGRGARSPFFAYVDEVAVLGRLPLPLDAVLERARGHGVGLTLSPQSLSQLGPELRTALLEDDGFAWLRSDGLKWLRPVSV